MGSQIEQIKKLYAKDKVYKIPQAPKEGQEQIDVTITALSLEDLSLLTSFKEGEDMPLNEIAKNAKILFASSLQISQEEASKISIDFMEDLLFAVMDANNLKESDMKKTGIKDFIEKKRAQIAEQKGEGNGTTGKAEE